MSGRLASEIAANLARVRAEIATAARAAGRDPAGITLIAVGKTHPAASVAAAIAAGQYAFGENRVQEAAEKYPALKAAYPGLELHLIGPLQTNKARDAVRLFDAIQSLDRPKLAAALATEIPREVARTGRSPKLYIQVNTGAEPQKAGVSPADADGFIAACRRDHGLALAGLMCIPPAAADPIPHFELLRALGRRHGLAELSMGMSADFPLAVAHGATHVRVGTAIFGRR